MPASSPAGRAPWWAQAVVYEVYVRSFADADGDGVGDLDGVRSRLGYLADLGVDAVWLTPFYASPQADHGYDVADHRSVEPRLGDLPAFDRLVAAAHEHGLRIVVDLVPNHVSAAHPWFAEALAAGRGAPERARFHFRPGSRSASGSGDEPPNDWTSMFGGPAWTPAGDGDWYLHLFDAAQPDLNWAHPDVRADFEETLRFWLDRGVDGFRVDVAGGLTKDPAYPDLAAGSDPHPHWDRDDVHDIYRSWRAILDTHPPGAPGQRLAVAEVWGDPMRTALYARRDELGQAFAFGLLHAPWSAAAWREGIDAQLAAGRAVGAAPGWVLSSHDFPRPATRHGLDRSLALHLLLLALPGAFYLYQGDELGLPDAPVPDEARRDPTFHRSGGREKGRDGARVPLPWTATRRGAGHSAYGFSRAEADPPWLPQPDDWGARAVSRQQEEPDSPLAVLRAAIRSRKSLWADAGAELEWLPAPDGCLLFRRGRAVCAVNFTADPLPAGTVPGRVVAASRHEVTDGLPAETAVWTRLP